MHIDQLYLKAFGRFTDYELDLSAGPHRFHLVYGANESGKSTTLRAISVLLFGFPHRTDDNYLHSNTKLRVGGRLVDEGQVLACLRRKASKSSLRALDDESVIEESQMQAMLGGITASTFTSRFGISHQELVDGGASILAGEGDVGQILFSAGAGVSKLREVQRSLDDAAAKHYVPRGSRGTINAALKDWDKLRKDLRTAQVAPTQFTELTDRLQQERGRWEQTEKARIQSAADLARLRAFEKALPLIPQWYTNQNERDELAGTPLLDEAFTERRREASKQREIAVSKSADLAATLSEINQQIDTRKPQSTLTNRAAEIEEVFKEISAHKKAIRDRQDLDRKRRNNDRKMIELLADLSIKIDSDDDARRPDAIGKSIDSIKLSESLRNHIRKLAGQYERLVSQRDDAADQWKTAQAALAETKTALSASETTIDPEIVDKAIQVVGDPEALLKSLADDQQQSDASAQRCKQQLSRLVGYDGTVQEAVELMLPSRNDIERLEDRWEQWNEQDRLLSKQIETLTSQQQTIQRETQAQQNQSSLPTEEELRQAREQRDQAIDKLTAIVSHQSVQPADSDALGSLVQPMTEARQAVRQADRMADQMRSHQAEVQKRESQLNRIAEIDSNLRSLQSQKTQHLQRLTQIQNEWKEVWRSAGIEPGDPTMMRRWFGDHEKLTEESERWANHRQRVRQTRDRIQHASQRLQHAIELATGQVALATSGSGSSSSSTPLLFDTVSTIDLDGPEELLRLFEQALTTRARVSEQHQERTLLRRKRDDLLDELPKLETQRNSSEAKLESWKEDWRKSTAKFASDQSATPDEVMAQIDQIVGLVEKKRETDILATRIESIGNDEQAFAVQTRQLADSVGIATDQDAPPEVIADKMYQKLLAEQASIKQLESLIAQRDKTARLLETQTDLRSQSDASLKQLCDEAGCGEPSELPKLEARSRRLSELLEQYRALASQLTLLAGDQDLDAFIAAASEQEAVPLAAQIDQEQQRLSELQEELAKISEQIGSLQNDVSRIDSSSRAAELSQSMQLLGGTIASESESYARHKIASLILRLAIDHYTQENQNPVLQRAKNYFSQLTLNEYVDLKIDFDAKGKTTLYGIRGDQGSLVPANCLSEGTADALYLALRLASLEHQISLSKPIPLVVDDCLVMLDDARAAAAMKVLSELSTKTQVVLLTHHEHLVDLASTQLKSDGVHIHRLANA